MAVHEMAWISNKSRRVIEVGLLGIALISHFGYVQMWDRYFDTLPHSPSQATGRIYADNFHGVALYETREERIRLHLLDYTSEGLFFLVIAVAGLFEWRSRNEHI